jgi:hypothetical protein
MRVQRDASRACRLRANCVHTTHVRTHRVRIASTPLTCEHTACECKRLTPRANTLAPLAPHTTRTACELQPRRARGQRCRRPEMGRDRSRRVQRTRTHGSPHAAQTQATSGAALPRNRWLEAPSGWRQRPGRPGTRPRPRRPADTHGTRSAC